MNGHVVALCGGVGGAKLAHGLALALRPEELSVIVNTGDDFQHLGLHIAPDLDSVMYALAGLSDPVRGWGRADESWVFMDALRGLGAETWFQLGDKDLAVHVERTRLLAQGATLSEVTAQLCAALSIPVRLLPMSDDPIRTRVLTTEGWLDFQEYFVRRQCKPAVRDFMFSGAQTARAQPHALATLARGDLRAVVICPSNPFVSVEPILAVPGMRRAIRDAAAPVLAVTPIIGGKAIKGPAAKMLAELGLDVSGAAVARHYAGLIDGFVIDRADPAPDPIEGVTFFSAATLMSSVDDRLELARAVLAAADSHEQRLRQQATQYRSAPNMPQPCNGGNHMTESSEPKELPAWIKDHVSRYLASNGEDGYLWDASLGGGKGLVPTLLLTTVGRKSGRSITLPLIFGRSGADYVVVASKGGAPTHPSWYLNLDANPEVQIQVKADKFKAIAHTANATERAALWPKMVEIYAPYEDYQKKTDRRIPIVVLKRA